MRTDARGEGIAAVMRRIAENLQARPLQLGQQAIQARTQVCRQAAEILDPRGREDTGLVFAEGALDDAIGRGGVVEGGLAGE